MHQFLRPIAALLLAGATPFTGSAALAQEPAPASSLVAGATVYDVNGEEVGKIAKVTGDRVAVSIDGNGLGLPRQAFVQGAKGPALKATKVKILSVLRQAEANAAAVGGALKPGAAVRSADGAVVLGKITSVTPQGALLTTNEGNITMPRAAFFLSKNGLAVKLSEKQFLDGVKAARAQKKGS
ncbi:hypothetical protein CDQ92_07900 [Sphingopyxis bauzanensis]|uniref:PRC-barrel domain-containing protein n=1 Tax=Sphingopyxis bauzanensis TaxID=651663 RepID=A0A246JVB9_9SPHN|nr:hypothetical protein [Sphingopyxis bauzanensis]OWQ97007.1 hypothetical protein CDQ92_07900 [Sphingopyxis bauzanensis]GGJ41941.1 hypothetical protein GCM10011393_10110 [Sphingopyxis bauzanensis]